VTQPEKAKRLRELHHSGQILVLPNAWDVASAVIFEQAGFPATATSSAGVAAVFGYPDGQHIQPELMLDMVRRIVHAVSTPVSADLESGYANPVQSAVRLMQAGGAGLNLEDTTEEDPSTLADLARQVELIRVIRSNTNLVINARTDVFLAGIGDPATRFDRTIERLQAYHAAGADSLFVPGVKDAQTIGRLAQTLKGPLNILAVAGSPSISELQKLGVARVSVGSGPMRAALGLARRMAQEFSEQGTYTAMTQGAVTYAEVQRMLTGKGV
jgi:2-methylisocitrate lyase-like PEP mutase family enzyme